MKNKFTIKDGKVYIELPRRKFPNAPLITVIDYTDFSLINSFKGTWRALVSIRKSDGSKIYYAAKSINTVIPGKNKYHCLHDVLMNVPIEHTALEVDHTNRDGLNNCRNNLQLVTRQENSFNHRTSIANTSGITRVAFHKPTKKWRAYITPNGKQKHLGLFSNIEMAIEARRKAERQFN